MTPEATRGPRALVRRALVVCAAILASGLLAAAGPGTAAASVAVASLAAAAGSGEEAEPAPEPDDPAMGAGEDATEQGDAVLPAAVAALLGDGLDEELARFPSATLGSLSGVVATLEPGRPRPRWEWNPDRLAGDATAPLIDRTSSWQVPLEMDGRVVGQVEVGGQGGEVAALSVSDDADAAREVAALPPGLPAVFDETTGGWFTIERGQVRAVDRVAGDNLVGSMPAADYAGLLALRAVQTERPSPAAGEPGAWRWWGPVAVGGGVVVVLLVALVSVWMNRPDDPAEDDEPGPPRGMLQLRRPATRATAAPAAAD